MEFELAKTCWECCYYSMATGCMEGLGHITTNVQCTSFKEATNRFV